MYTDKIREAFERAHFTTNSQITRQNLYDFLSKLTVTLLLYSLETTMMWR